MKVISKINIFKMYVLMIIKRMNLNNSIYKILKKVSPFKILESNNIECEKNRLELISPKPKGSSFGNNNMQKKEVDLQIIVPCYNVENYVKKCVDSILSQKTKYTYKLIIIDDGSTDRTAEIVDTYSSYPQVEVIHQKNRGLSGARNTGLAKIFGEYIMFVDSDDKLEENAVEKLIKRAYESKADIVDGGFSIFDDNGIRECRKGENSDNVDPYKSIKGVAWGKVTRSKLFENIIFPEGFLFEDSVFAFLLFPKIKSASTLGESVYSYRRNKSGITYTARKNPKGVDNYWILEQMIEDQKKLGIDKNQDIYEQVILQIYINFNRTYWFNNRIKKDIFMLSSFILNSEFKEYKTQNSRFMDLEESLRNNNYTLYSYFCSLKQF